jgi:hypothetical protein
MTEVAADPVSGDADSEKLLQEESEPTLPASSALVQSYMGGGDDERLVLLSLLLPVFARSCSNTEYPVSQLLGRCQELLAFGTVLVEYRDQSTVEPM